MTYKLADYLEVWGFDGDTVIFSDGSLGFGLELDTVDPSCWDNETTNSLLTRVRQFLNGLPSGIDVQLVQDIISGNTERLDQQKALARSAKNSAAIALANTRAAMLEAWDSGGFIPRFRTLAFVRSPMQSKLIHRPKLLSSQGKFQQLAEGVLSRELLRLGHLKEDFKQGLKSIGLKSSDLSADSIVGLMSSQWNPRRTGERTPYNPENIRSSVVFTDAQIEERGFSLSNEKYRFVSMKILPEQTYSAMAIRLLHLPMGSRLFLSVHVPDQMEEQKRLQTKRRMAFSVARGKQNRVNDLESEAKLQDLETLLEQMISQGEKVFNVSLGVLLHSPSSEELDNQVSQTLSIFRELSGAEGMEETLATFPIFSEVSIPNARSRTRAKSMKTSTLADFFPVFGPWGGVGGPSVLLRSRLGSLVCFDPFADLGNANQLIAGGSGSGKSFMTNLLLLQMLKENPRLFFVDIGGSYQKLCENLSGQYIGLGGNKQISINPFDLSPGETQPSSHKIKFLLGLIDLMTKEEGVEHLPRLERAEIEDAIQKLYADSATPTLSKLRDSLSNHNNPEIKKLGRILNSWCGKTPFGEYVDRPTNVVLDNPIVAFDLKGIESYPDLQAVCLFIITDFVWREVQRDRNEKKFLVFDECWKLLKSDSGFIEEVFRTFRKYNSSAIAISQNLDDFAKSKIAGAILPNCAIKWLLMQGNSDSTRLQAVLGLNPNEIELISSLKQEKGHYSEAFLMAGAEHSVVVIEATPLEYWIATTHPKDLGAIEQLKLKSPELTSVQILEILSQKYPHGFSPKGAV